MAKKKKSKNSVFIKALGIFVGSMVLVWGLASCKDNSVPTIVEQANVIDESEGENTVKEQDVMVETIAETETIVTTSTPEELEEPVAIEQAEVVEEYEYFYPQGDEYGSDIDIETLSTVIENCTFGRNSEHLPVTSYIKADLEKFGAYASVDTGEKVVYLTFDEGYENGYTESILDTLLENNVQATFFVTGSYIRNNADLVTRMKEEGHLVGNHSMTHPNFGEISDEEVLGEILDTEKLMLEMTGYSMDKFFRPPEGAFSERSLYLTRTTGNRTILWSMAYTDWLVDDQKGADYAYNHVMENYHNGAIILLHAVSESNAEALDDILKGLQAEGYSFGNLYEVE